MSNHTRGSMDRRATVPANLKSIALPWVICAMFFTGAVRGGVDYVNNTGEVQTIRATYNFSTTVTSATRKYTNVTHTQGYYESNARLNIYFYSDIADEASTSYAYTLVSSRDVDYVIQPNSAISIQDTQQTDSSSTSKTSPPEEAWYYHFWDPTDVGNVFDISATRVAHEETTTAVLRETSLTYFVRQKADAKAVPSNSRLSTVPVRPDKSAQAISVSGKLTMRPK